MALKRKHKETVDDINFKMAAAAEKGVAVCYDRTNAGFVKIESSLSTKSKVAGILWNDVVDKDFGAVPQNFQTTDVGLSGQVRLIKKGELITDSLKSGSTFGVGSGVYLATNGELNNKPASGFEDDPAGERLGTALGSVDSDGFLEIYFDIG